MSGIIPDAFASTINGVSGISGSLSSMIYGAKEGSPTSPGADEEKKDPFTMLQEEVQDTMRRVREHDNNLENIQSEVFGASLNDLRIRAFVQKVREEVLAIKSKQVDLEKRVQSGFGDLEDRILHLGAASARPTQDSLGPQEVSVKMGGRLSKAGFATSSASMSPSANIPQGQDASDASPSYRKVVEDTQKLKDMCGRIDSRLDKACDDFNHQKIQMKALKGLVRETDRRYDNREQIEQEYKAMEGRLASIQVQRKEVTALEKQMAAIEPVWRNTKKKCEEILEVEPARQKDVDALQSRLEEAVSQHEHLQEAVCGAASQRDVDDLHARLEEVQQTTLSNLQGQIDAMLKEANDKKRDNKDLAEVQARLEAFVSQIEHAFELFYEEQGSFKKAKVAFDLRIGALEGRLAEVGLIVRDTKSQSRLV